MKYELIETVFTYRIKMPKLTDTQYLDMCAVMTSTLLDEDTRCGEEEGYIIVNTTEPLAYVKRVIREVTAFAKSKPMTLPEPVKVSDLPMGSKFLYKSVSGKKSFIVYTVSEDPKPMDELNDRIYGTNSNQCSVWLRPHLEVYPVDTKLNFLKH